jgi:putative ABC transport system ATP-binding protein
LKSDYVIYTEDLAKHYQMGGSTVKALDGVDARIVRGEYVSIVGPSGSGKTTLLNLIGALDSITGGELQVLGRDIAGLSRQERAELRLQSLGFVFQAYNLIPVLTVFENIEYPLIIVKNTLPGERKKRVMAVLEAVGMVDQKDKYPDQISGGQKQRVAVARALVTNPQLVLADEPTANLDHATAFTVIDLMKKMKDELKTTFVFSTHDQKIVGEAEIIYSLEDGELVGKKAQGGKNNG